MKKVLIVDDTSFLRTSLRLLLERNGYQVVGEAENGVFGVIKYKELQPDVVTMDITMKTMGGIQAVKAIRQLDPKAKILMISALGQEEYIREAIMAGAKGFLVKPFKEEQVIKAIEKL